MEPVTISIDDACKAIGIGRNKVYDLIAAGSLDTIRIGRRQLVRVDSIKKLAGAKAEGNVAFGSPPDIGVNLHIRTAQGESLAKNCPSVVGAIHAAFWVEVFGIGTPQSIKLDGNTILEGSLLELELDDYFAKMQA